MPKMGESVMEATILTWLKKEGESIEADESLLEVATDKVDTEIPTTHAGVVKKILAKEGDVIQVGSAIAVIATEVEDVISDTPDSKGGSGVNETNGQDREAVVEEAAATEGSPSMLSSTSDGNRFYSPLVRNIAKKEGITLEELDRVPGSGKEGRVTKKDILSYLKSRQTVYSPAGGASSSVKSSVPVSISEEDEIVEMDRMRKMIADRMVESKRIAPHVTSFVEADVTNVVNWRNTVKKTFMEREGEPLTFTPIFIEAVIKAIRDYPNINIQVDGSRIIKKKRINIGMAVALPTGNLIVPVIHDADKLSLMGLSKKVNDLARRARNNELKPDELSGGTFTVSNVGSFGNIMGTPIILQPQVGILALGAIQKKPAVIETPHGDTIGIRHKMFLSHSYDHRVVDGALGGMVVRRVADYLEDFDFKRPL